MPPMDEENVLNMLEKASRSVVNTSTMKFVQNLFYQAVPLGGIGSGTIIDSNGLILTNNHVVGAPRKSLLVLRQGVIRLRKTSNRSLKSIMKLFFCTNKLLRTALPLKRGLTARSKRMFELEGEGTRANLTENASCAVWFSCRADSSAVKYEEIGDAFPFFF